jgi:hypothetical protein
VRKKPGSTSIVRIPKGAISGVSDSIHPSMPNFAAAYAVQNIWPAMPAVEEMELASRLPKPRTLTMPEHSAMPVFDATAFAMTFLYFRNRKRLGEERKAIRSALC